ncbi:phage terminase small subunit P27 family, partial [Lactobacillus acetotolerans]|uniref:phage terminase small subunit P27 family n=1 Tax=Lactobacillus acetotolerans TaxID=1600 RepID=UPI002FD9D0BF
DANLIELYCSQYEIYRKAYESIHDKGIQQEITKPIQNAAGKILGEKSMGFKRNPATSVYNDAIKQLTTIGMQLGLSPKSRADLLESADDEIDLKAGMSEFM